MLKLLKKVAVTGGPGCGKSAACRLFEQQGAYVVDADEVAHGLLSPDAPSGKRVIQLLGPSIVHDGIIDRKIVADRVFRDAEALQALETIIHPAVQETIATIYKAATALSLYPLFVVEVPLLFEAGWDKDFDVTIAVVADENVCRARFGVEQYDLRMRRQMPPLEKAKRAQYRLDNNKTLAELKEQVISLMKQLGETSS
ncbi:MAG: Dephospho-CoA kinase [Chlamydiota bacterium]|jgi:dephospho-CoA kinase